MREILVFVDLVDARVVHLEDSTAGLPEDSISPCGLGIWVIVGQFTLNGFHVESRVVVGGGLQDGYRGRFLGLLNLIRFGVLALGLIEIAYCRGPDVDRGLLKQFLEGPGYFLGRG